MVRIFFIIWFLFILLTFTRGYLAEAPMSGKDIFYNVKGLNGSCSTCHPGGGTAGRWDSENKEISEDGDKVIPSLKGIGKKKTPEQIEKAIKLVSIKYKVPVNDAQIKALVNYVLGL